MKIHKLKDEIHPQSLLLGSENAEPRSRRRGRRLEQFHLGKLASLKTKQKIPTDTDI